MFQVIHSSAGAGKTHTLVKHYLLRCLQGGAANGHRRVLALTFTNKAAAEMRERVMEYLQVLATSEGEGSATISDLRSFLMGQLGIDQHELRSSASEALSAMLHDRCRVAIDTIDAFIRRVVRPFARDLRLDQDLEMTTEQEHYRSLAVEAVLSEVGTNEALTRILLRASTQLLDDERSWDVTDPLIELSKELDKENTGDALAFIAALSPDELFRISAALRNRINNAAQKIAQLGEQALGLIADTGLQVGDLNSKSSGVYGHFRKVATFNGGPISLTEKRRTLLVEGPLTGKQANAAAQLAGERILPELQRIQQKVQRTYREEYVVPRAIRNQLMLAAVLSRVELHLEEIKADDGVLFFSDLTRRIAAVVQHEPAPFIYERIGERYRHIMIDEFQDTSVLQWHDLIPLAENALSNGGSVLLVGDAKQAIYRWRNGEVRQFANLPGIFRKEQLAIGHDREQVLKQHHVPVEPLGFNFRSGRTIVQFNNALFNELSKYLSEGLQGIYKDLDQRPATSTEGYVELTLLEEIGTKSEQQEMILDDLLHTINAAQKDGFRPIDIAVLARTGAQARAISQHLTANGLRVSSLDGLRLGGDAAVELMIALLRYRYEASDEHAAVVVGRAATLFPKYHDLMSISNAGEMHVRARDLLHAKPYQRIAPTLLSILRRQMLSFDLNISDDAHLMELFDEVHQFEQRHGADLGAFLEHWERIGKDRVVQSVPAHDQVHIMTVHRSKGAQFPVVMVPFTEMRGSDRGKDRIWINTDLAELPMALVQAKKALAETGVPEMLEEEELSQLDELDLLYVAFTRPKERLYATVSPGSNSPLVQHLQRMVEQQGDGPVLQLGEKIRWEPRPTNDQRITVAPVSSTPQVIEKKVRYEASEDWEPTARDNARSHGDKLHELFAELTTTADLGPTIDRWTQQGRMDQQLANELHGPLQDLLESAELQPFFKSGIRVLNERDLITDDDRTIRPDRVVYDGDIARVLDIKTGAPRSAHHDQVSQYMRALEQLGAAQVEGAILYLGPNELIPVQP